MKKMKRLKTTRRGRTKIKIKIYIYIYRKQKTDKNTEKQGRQNTLKLLKNM